MTLCEYKDIFGKPDTGIHSSRLFGIAFVDLFLTLLAGIGVKYMFPKYNIILIWIVLFVIAIIVHKLFCVNTTVNKLIFGVV